MSIRRPRFRTGGVGVFACDVAFGLRCLLDVGCLAVVGPSFLVTAQPRDDPTSVGGPVVAIPLESCSRSSQSRSGVRTRTTVRQRMVPDKMKVLVHTQHTVFNSRILGDGFPTTNVLNRNDPSDGALSIMNARSGVSLGGICSSVVLGARPIHPTPSLVQGG